MNCLAHPFDGHCLSTKKKRLKRELLASGRAFTAKKIALLGGSTTAEIKDLLELFLLGHGLKPEFYESGYAGYWREAMFGAELEAFGPEVVFIHTTSRNIAAFPALEDDRAGVEELLERQFAPFAQMWDRLLSRGAAVIQNNFERPAYRLLGNRDISDFRGRSNFISRLNQKFYDYAGGRPNFYINDLDYLSASYGLEKWIDPASWHLYKYALNTRAIPELAFSVANIIKSIYGRNKKALALDLDNTLWGGEIGDDGPEGIELGRETPAGQAYTEFQEYVKAHQSLGILLAVCSKNDLENALAGLNHPDSLLSPADFAVLKANWENKDHNLLEIARELNLGPDSLVFVDDNPAERALAAGRIPGLAVPEMGNAEDYISRLDKSGFFEVTALTADDLGRARMYRDDSRRAALAQRFEDYRAYLTDLEMTAVIRDFEPYVLQRLAQLANKTNQFNLTARPYSEGEMAALAADGQYIRLYGRLKDKFGDNGIVSVIIGRQDGKSLHIDLWVMSCRVFKRDLELAMMDRLVEEARAAAIEKIIGYYRPTAKNGLVREFYGSLGFAKAGGDGEKTVWELDLRSYEKKNRVIRVDA